MDHFPLRYVSHNHFSGPPDWAQISPVGFPLAVLDVARPGVRQLSVGHRMWVASTSDDRLNGGV